LAEPGLFNSRFSVSFAGNGRFFEYAEAAAGSDIVAKKRKG